MIPPLLMHLKVRRSARRRLNLWLPVFLLWPAMGFVAVTLIAISPLLAIGQPSGRARRMVSFVLCTTRCLAALKGLKVTVADQRSEFHLRFL